MKKHKEITCWPRGRGTQLANGRRPTAFAIAGILERARPPRVWLAPSARKINLKGATNLKRVGSMTSALQCQAPLSIRMRGDENRILEKLGCSIIFSRVQRDVLRTRFRRVENVCQTT